LLFGGQVAGVAALVWSNYPGCTNSQIRNVLLKTALDVSGMGGATCNINYGHGIVQAKAAMDLLASQGCGAGGAPAGTASGGCGQVASTPPAPQTPPPTPPPTPSSAPISMRLEVTTGETCHGHFTL